MNEIIDVEIILMVVFMVIVVRKIARENEICGPKLHDR